MTNPSNAQLEESQGIGFINPSSEGTITIVDDLVFGTLNNDRLNATNQDNPYTGNNQITFLGVGEDTVDGTGAVGNNRIYASSDNDEILASVRDRVFAGAGNDRVDASLGGSENRLYGQAGNDELFAGNNDVLLGGEGEDRLLIGTQGDNLLTGNAGADQFWILTAQIPSRSNTITDFTSGEDIIGLEGFPELTFDDLTFTQEDSDTIISLGSDSELVNQDTPLAELQGIQANSLTDNDFTFVAQV